jgi:hypothetical protein
MLDKNLASSLILIIELRHPGMPVCEQSSSDFRVRIFRKFVPYGWYRCAVGADGWYGFHHFSLVQIRLFAVRLWNLTVVVRVLADILLRILRIVYNEQKLRSVCGKACIR